MSDPATPVPPAAVPPASPPKRHWTGFAITLLTIGVLILIPSGLCTGIFGVGALYDMVTSSPGEGGAILAEALLIGGIPIAIGGLLVFAGFKARKKA